MTLETRRGAFASLVRLLAVALAVLLPVPVTFADRAPIAPASPAASVLAATTYPLSLVDDDGRAVTVAKEPRRIVSAAPSTTEILFAVGLGGRVVGVTDFCDYPEAALAVPKIGGFKPNLEAIIGAQPDLVLAVRGFPADIIANLSTMVRLEAGDLIYSGTPSGVGPLLRGDVLEAGVEGVGSLHARIV